MEESHHHKTREKILLAARKEFAAKGVAGARMEAISRKAGVNKAMLHYYFKSKKNLYMQVLLNVIGAESDRNKDSDSQCVPGEKLEWAVQHMIHMHLEERDVDFRKIMAWEVAEGSKHLKIIARDYFISSMQQLISLIQERVDTGEFQIKNPEFAIWSLISMLVFYNSNHETFVGSELYEALYSEKGKESYKKFVTDSFYQMLSPGNARTEGNPQKKRA